ncbi:MAG: DUF1071 domain-containing protein [Waterburya sp.]
MTDLKTLVILPEDYERNYNLDITPYVKKDFQGCDYITWSNSLKLLHDYKPNLSPELVKTETLYGANEPIGVLLHIAIKDTYTGSITPILQYPVMGNKNQSLAYPDSRDFSDNLLRGYVKAIAIYTGIGYRLFTRESIDLPGGGKDGTCQHPKFKALLEINRLLLQTDIRGIDYVIDKPHFGMTCFDLTEIVETLREVLGVTSEDKTSNTLDEIPKAWKNVQDALDFAAKTLNISIKDADSLYQQTPADSNGFKKTNFYRKILQLSTVKA